MRLHPAASVAGRRRARRAIALVLASAAVTGCATLPTEGPVRQADERSYSTDEPAVRRLPPPPAPGATPEEIVRGFLLAAASTEDSYGIARRFLTPSAADRWRPGAGVTILDADYTLRTGDATDVRLDGRRVGSITETAAYRPVRPTEPMSVTFATTRVGDEWRISKVPDGLYLSREEVTRIYRSFSAYYVEAGGGRLVPDPVVLPFNEALADALLLRLLRGPASALATAVTDAVPAGARLEGGTVPIRNGVAEVRLRTPGAPEAFDARLLAAQLLHTVRQVAGVTAVRTTVNGAPLDVPGLPTPLPVDALSELAPDIDVPGTPYAVVSGRAGVVEEARFVPFPGPTGSGRPAVREPAVSIDGTALAAVSTDGRRFLTGRLGGADNLSVRLRGANFTDPTYDVTGTVWVLDAGRAGSEPVLWSLPPSGRALRVELPALDGARVRGMRVARSGVRIALIARRGGQDELHVGVLTTRPGGTRAVAVDGQPRIAPQFTAVRDLAWRDAQTLAVLAVEPGSVTQPYLVSLDGFAIEALSPVPNAVSVAAASGDQPLLVGTDNGRIYQASGRTWRERGRGSDPAYRG